MTDANLTGANITGANLTNAILTGADLTDADLASADLTGAVGMDSATLTGITWTNTICPDSTNSNDNGNTCVGHL